MIRTPETLARGPPGRLNLAGPCADLTTAGPPGRADGGQARGLSIAPNGRMHTLAFAVVAMGLLVHRAHAEDDVIVHLRADSDAVRIIRVDGDRPEIVCAGLCDKPLPRDGLYELGGDGVPRTRPFTLGDPGTDLTLRVDAGSSGQQVAGAVTAFTGGTTLLFGLLYRWVLAVEDIDNDHPADHNRDPLFIGSMTAGLVLGVGGLVMLATSGTFVTTNHGVSFSALPTPSLRF